MTELFVALVSRARRRFGIQEADAEDVAQDALVKLLQKQRRNREDYLNPAGLAFFLLGDAHFQFCRRLRRGGDSSGPDGRDELSDVAELSSDPRLVDEIAVLGVLLEAVPTMPSAMIALVRKWLSGNWGMLDCARALGVSRRSVFMLRQKLLDFLHSRGPS